jgi:MtN3 and saliva related transmembrane protein
MSIELLGYAAAACTTFAFVPQAILVYKTKNTESISLVMFIIFTFGILLWGIYGFLINSLPILTANLITIFLAGYILVMKILEPFRNKRSKKL